MEERPAQDEFVPQEENKGSAGSPHSTGRRFHKQSTNFENMDEAPPASCESCGASIPPTRARCKDHRRDSTASSNNGKFTWKISQIGFAIVTGKSNYHAVARGSAAFDFTTEVEAGKQKVELVYDLSGEPSKTLTSGWGGTLPETARVNSNVGEKLMKKALNKTKVSGDSEEKYLFNEKGDVINDMDKVDQIMDDNPTEHVWIVPGVISDKKVNTENKKIRYVECENCGETQHALEDTKKRKHHREERKWRCLNCLSTTTTGGKEKSREMRQFITAKNRNSADNILFSNMMNKIEDNE